MRRQDLSSDGAGPSVLIVDADDDQRHRSVAELSTAGYACREALSGPQAQAYLGLEQISLVICDVSGAHVSTLEMLDHLRDEFPDVGLVLTSAVDDPATAALAVGLEVDGYLIKPFSSHELLVAVSSGLRRGRLESSRRHHTSVANRSTETRPDLSSTPRGGRDLSERERQIIRLVADGLSNQAIAEHLHLSLHTVRNHVQNILAKLDAHTRLEAVAIATRRGAIPR
jgi:DNA-binding NarL/FixJ family response regulator